MTDDSHLDEGIRDAADGYEDMILGTGTTIATSPNDFPVSRSSSLRPSPGNATHRRSDSVYGLPSKSPQDAKHHDSPREPDSMYHLPPKKALNDTPRSKTSITAAPGIESQYSLRSKGGRHTPTSTKANQVSNGSPSAGRRERPRPRNLDLSNVSNGVARAIATRGTGSENTPLSRSAEGDRTAEKKSPSPSHKIFTK